MALFDCDNVRSTFTYILIGIISILIITIIFSVSLFIKKLHKLDNYQQHKGTKIVEWTGFTLSFTTTLGMIMHCIYTTDFCTSGTSAISDVDPILDFFDTFSG